MTRAGTHHRRHRKDIGKDVILVLGMAAVLVVLVWIIAKSAGGKDIAKANVSGSSAANATARQPAVAGQFYPSDKEELSATVESLLKEAPDYPDVWGVRGLIAPHAGYQYSGSTAAYGYRQLRMSRYGTVIVMGPSHRVYLDKAYIPDADYYETPLGRVPISPKAKEMMKEGIFASKPDGQDSREHSIEVQVPFLQKVLPPFQIIPIMVGDVDPDRLADVLDRYADDDTLIVASSDLSHYLTYDECAKRDRATVGAMLEMEPDRIGQGDACGQIPVQALLMLAKKRGWRSRPFDMTNSGDTTGDNGSVVGYASIGFYDGLTPAEDQMLLDIAQKTLESRFAGGHLTVDEGKLPPKLLEKRGCFVTLNKGGQLRGCVGSLSAQDKLYRCVQSNAVNAALNDGRFDPVVNDELRDIRIEVSVLTEPLPLAHSSPEDLKAKLIPKVDGVILRSGERQSTYLPVVWEQLPEKEDFLSQLCLKQGSPGDCWKSAEIYTYQAQEFHQDGFR
ncbi:MAG: AmmeMemoRadiSam system protein B [Candidatus Altiarchaeota archaeon]